MPIPAIAMVAIGVASALGVTGAAVATVAIVNSSSQDAAVIERVIDGDTVDVRLGGTTERIRLLNIDAPEDNAATGVSECLGAEATAELTHLLPAGTEVQLQYDSERHDRYDRLLAGIFIDDTFINAEMARAGLAGSLVVGDNDRFIDDVASAEDEALTEQRGMYGTDLPCTLGSIVASYEKQATDAAPAVIPSDSAGIAAALVTATAAVSAAKAADASIDAATWVPQKILDGFHGRTHVIWLSAKQDQKRLQSGFDGAVAREAEAARVAEEARIAAEEAAAEKAAAEQAARDKAAADQAAAEAARRAAAQRPSGSTGGSSSGGATGGSGGYDGYTGCRAYGQGGNAVDEKGRAYMKIDCVTKAPIG